MPRLVISSCGCFLGFFFFQALDCKVLCFVAVDLCFRG